jgi:hypothetical protein
MEFDTVVSHYSTAELLELMEISRPTRDAIVQATADFAQRYVLQPDLARFAIDVQRALLEAFPEAKRLLTRLVAVDSYYRDTLTANNSTDSFSFTMSEKLVNVVSVALYSVEIPYSWYTFAAAKGTTSVVVSTVNAANDPVELYCTIADGNYTSGALIQAVAAAINTNLATLGFPANPTVSFVIDPVTARLNITAANLVQVLSFGWFDPRFQTAALENTRINKHLGWALGFRTDQTVIDPFTDATLPADPAALHTIVAPSLLSVNPTKSIFMRLDDHVPGRFTNGVVTTSYVDPNRAVVDPNLQDVTFRISATGRDTHTQAIAPRRLTAKQLFATNAVADATLTFSRTRDAPNDSDLFAKIPLKKPGEWGLFRDDCFDCCDDGPTKTIVEFSGPLQLNVRDYFGPVTLTSFTVSLFDDRGNSLGLNGLDWSFTLLIKQERLQG